MFLQKVEYFSSILGAEFAPEANIAIFRNRFFHFSYPALKLPGGGGIIFHFGYPDFALTALGFLYFANFKIRVFPNASKNARGGCYDFFTLATRRSFYLRYPALASLWLPGASLNSATRLSLRGVGGWVHEVCARRGVLKVSHVTSSRDSTFLVLLSFVALHSQYNYYVSYPTF